MNKSYETHAFDVLRMLVRCARLGLNYRKDAFKNKKAESKQDIPWNFTAVTPQWFTEILCADVPGSCVESISLGIGHDGTSGRQQYLLKYNEIGEQAGLPSSIFAKGTPTLTTRISMTSVPSMELEAKFYNRIGPELKIEAPKGYHSAYDLKSGRSIHLLEDLVATKGARFPNGDTVITKAHAESIVDVLTDLHAPYYDSPRFSGDLEDIMSWPENFRRMSKLMNLKKYHLKGWDKAIAFIPPELHARRDDTWPAIIKSVELHHASPQTLTHVDVHLGNWYITRDEKMGLLDWQCLNKGHWARDFAYAITATLTVEDRREWEEELLKLYLQLLKDKAGVVVSFDEAWLCYRQQIFGALVLWTPTYAPPFFAPDNMQPESLSIEMIKRFTTAIADLDSFGSLDLK